MIIRDGEVPCPNCDIGLMPRDRIVVCPYCGTKSKYVKEMRGLFFLDA